MTQKFNLEDIPEGDLPKNPQRPPGRLDLLQGCAVHEAGHATVATYLRQEVEEIVMLYTWIRSGSELALTRKGQTVRYIENATPLDIVAVEIAGLAAESIPDSSVTIDYLERYEGTDLRYVYEALDQLVPPPDAKHRKQHIERQWNRSRAIIEARWSSVQTLANALIDEWTAAEQRITDGSDIRATLSGPKLAGILAFAKQ